MLRLVDSTALAINWVLTAIPDSMEAPALSPSISMTKVLNVKGGGGPLAPGGVVTGPGGPTAGKTPPRGTGFFDGALPNGLVPRLRLLALAP